MEFMLDSAEYMHDRVYLSCPSLKRSYEMVNTHLSQVSDEMYNSPGRAAWHYWSRRNTLRLQ
eukprot:5927386-Prorocentrum_lima.AAC.1